ncbi:hypothetical protein ACT7DD_31435 [Bacillus paranthracis]
MYLKIMRKLENYINGRYDIAIRDMLLSNLRKNMTHNGSKRTGILGIKQAWLKTTNEEGSEMMEYKHSEEQRRYYKVKSIN